MNTNPTNDTASTAANLGASPAQPRNPLTATTPNAGASPTALSARDYQYLSDRFAKTLSTREQSYQDAASNDQGRTEVPADPAARAAPSRLGSDADDEADQDDAATDEMAAVPSTVAPIVADQTQAFKAAIARTTLDAGAPMDPALSASATQSAVNANLAHAQAVGMPTGVGPTGASSWSVSLPELSAWTMQATQSGADGRWSLNVTAPGASALGTPTPAENLGAQTALLTQAATAQAATLAAQAQALAQRLAGRDVALERVSLRRRESNEEKRKHDDDAHEP